MASQSVLALVLSVANPGPSDFAFHHEGVIGTFLDLRVRAESIDAAREAEGVALGEIDRLAAVFSGYDASSAFSRWSATDGTPEAVPIELFELLRGSEYWTGLTGGAFDPRAAALVQLWREAEVRGVAPGGDELAAALGGLERPAWRLDLEARTAARSGRCPITLDGIATGTIVDRVVERVMAVGGVRGVLVNLGGDLAARGGAAVLVAIPDPADRAEYAPPLDLLDLRDQALTTSGRSPRDFRLPTGRRSHILDPRTGRPADHVASASVIAPTCEAADALATAFNVLPVEESLRLADALPGVACLIVEAGGRIATSAGWGALAVAPDDPAPSAEEAAAFEMAIDLEINKPADASPYRRPYLAVWLEDAEGFPVRTISLLVSFGGPGPKWISDLKRWHRSDKERMKVDKTDRLYTVSKSTRPPGRFEIVWDGKDDQGKPVPPGEYTLYIEAAREHGTYQLIRVPVELGAGPFTADPEGNVEIKAAHIEYRPKAARP